MNRGEIRAAIQQRIDDTSGVRATVAELDRYIDDGYVDLAERTGAVVRTETLSCPAGEHFIPLSADCLNPLLMLDVASGLPIDFVDWPLIDKKDTLFIRKVAGRPYCAATWGMAELLIYPAYETAGSMEIMQSIVPGALGSDGASPALPEQHHQALVYYGHYRVLLKDAHGDLAGQRLGRAKRQYGYYLAAAGLLADWTMDRHGEMGFVFGTDVLRTHDESMFPELRESMLGETL